VTTRTFFIGDVHGCIDELDALVGLLAPAEGDRFAFVGDLVDRGPSSALVIRRVRALREQFPGSVCVSGNHDEVAVRKRERGRALPEWSLDATSDDWAFLEAMPLYARIDGVLVVHGGIYPRFYESEVTVGEPPRDWRRGGGKPMDRRRRFLRIRQVDSEGNMVGLGDETAECVHWSSRYDGRDGFVVFGHDPQLSPPEPLRAAHAMGIDTGCCFGGRLTALVVESGARASDGSIVSVAGKRYADPRKPFVE
jgi:diadenosine tetraphosphatase ApaH/serine/threonine PP2A family protein phosphatase